jgi:Arc/MetJ family transcription regulator
MYAHMKTTVEISDPLLAEARQAAAEEGTTVRALIEEGLRRVLRDRVRRRAFRLRRVTFKGRGLQSAAGDGSWERLRAFIYEDRGS